MRIVIIALSVGLFVTLVLAWYHGERCTARRTELLILALLLQWRRLPLAICRDIARADWHAG